MRIQIAMLAMLLLSTGVGHGENLPASVAQVCTQPAKLDATAGNCLDNTLYQQAGQNCVNYLLSSIQKETARASNKIADDNHAAFDNGKNRQAGNMGAANSDYGTTHNSLSFMLDEASKTYDLLEKYRNGIVLPMSCGADCAEYEDAIWSHPCYADTALALEKMIKQVDEIKANLTSAKKQDLALYGSSGTRKANLEGSAGKAAASTYGRGGEAVSGKSANGQSTITGEIKEPKLPSSP